MDVLMTKILDMTDNEICQYRKGIQSVQQTKYG